MRALQVTLHALWTEHAAIEGKFLPWLEADNLVVLHLELNAALLAAEAAMGLDQFVRFDAGFQVVHRSRKPGCGPNACMNSKVFSGAMRHAHPCRSLRMKIYPILFAQRPLIGTGIAEHRRRHRCLPRRPRCRTHAPKLALGPARASLAGRADKSIGNARLGLSFISYR